MTISFKELKDMNREELESKLKELQHELLKLNQQISTGTPPKSPGSLRTTRKIIAKIKFLLQKEDTTHKEETK
jgi:ribosomal protein L29